MNKNHNNKIHEKKPKRFKTTNRASGFEIYNC